MSDQAATGSTEGMAERVQGTASKLYDASGRVINDMAQHPEQGAEQLARFAREQPLTTALLALGIGYLLGKIT